MEKESPEFVTSPLFFLVYACLTLNAGRLTGRLTQCLTKRHANGDVINLECNSEHETTAFP